jgi:hypothetical protein
MKPVPKIAVLIGFIVYLLRVMQAHFAKPSYSEELYGCGKTLSEPPAASGHDFSRAENYETKVGL